MWSLAPPFIVIVQIGVPFATEQLVPQVPQLRMVLPGPGVPPAVLVSQPLVGRPSQSP